jgi:hypothetical protein
VNHVLHIRHERNLTINAWPVRALTARSTRKTPKHPRIAPFWWGYTESENAIHKAAIKTHNMTKCIRNARIQRLRILNSQECKSLEGKECEEVSAKNSPGIRACKIPIDTGSHAHARMRRTRCVRKRIVRPLLSIPFHIRSPAAPVQDRTCTKLHTTQTEPSQKNHETNGHGGLVKILFPLATLAAAIGSTFVHR